jgi:uncharacterized protein YaiL (DUF2058 family)
MAKSKALQDAEARSAELERQLRALEAKLKQQILRGNHLARRDAGKAPATASEFRVRCEEAKRLAMETGACVVVER